LNAQQIENLIRDKRVSDDVVAQAIREFTTAQEGESRLVPVEPLEPQVFEDLGVLTQRFRPHVYATLAKEVAAAHRGCCGAPAAVE
jgi:hypothetical protein